MRPSCAKAHFALHLERQYRVHKRLVSCWVHERRRKEIKRYPNQQTNLKQGTEKHLLQEVMLTHLDSLNGIPLERTSQLINP